MNGMEFDLTAFHEETRLTEQNGEFQYSEFFVSKGPSSPRRNRRHFSNPNQHLFTNRPPAVPPRILSKKTRFSPSATACRPIGV
jgi:hypothetical protein